MDLLLLLFLLYSFYIVLLKECNVIASIHCNFIYCMFDLDYSISSFLTMHTDLAKCVWGRGSQ